MFENYRVGIREIAEELSSSYGWTPHILIKGLGKKRVNAWLVPKELNVPSNSSMIVTDFVFARFGYLWHFFVFETEKSLFRLSDYPKS